MNILGLRLCEHDSNISYYDGNSIKYLKTERIYHEKHRGENNFKSWKYIIQKQWGIDFNDLDIIGIVVDEWHHGLQVPKHSDILGITGFNHLGANPKTKVYKVEHHLAHLYSCNLISNKEYDVGIIIDGFGEWDISHSIFKNDKLIDIGRVSKNGSIGFEMSSMSGKLNIPGHYLDIAGKVMGIQSYGQIDWDFIDFLQSYSIYEINQVFDKRNWHKYIGSKHLADLNLGDWIASIHKKIELEILNFFDKFCDKDDIIFYSGGVAQNVIWNTALRDKFKNIVIPPHCNDEGLSLGVVEYLRKINNLPKLRLENYPYCQTDESPLEIPSEKTIQKVAQYLYEGKTVGWYQGNGEIGPRALGNRSILMNPLIENGKSKINKIKKRENYRPFGASVLLDKANDFFDINYENQHMLYVNKVKDTRLSCITHVDGTCRIQTVTSQQNKVYYDLIQEFEKLSGVPIVLNTSLNVNGKPIAGKIENAEELLYSSELDILVIGNQIKYNLNER